MTLFWLWLSGVSVGVLVGAGGMSAVWHYHEQQWRRHYARQLRNR